MVRLIADGRGYFPRYALGVGEAVLDLVEIVRVLPGVVSPDAVAEGQVGFGEVIQDVGLGEGIAVIAALV
jgi:hypothetical protein